MNVVATLSPSDVTLPHYEAMCQAIAVCYRIDEVKGIQDKAAALRAYARQIHNRDAEVQFAEIKVRAERRCGELLEDLRVGGARASSGQTRAAGGLKIKDLGMTQMDAHRFRQTAKVSTPAFEAHLTDRRQRRLPVTSLSVRSLASVRMGSLGSNAKALTAIEALSELDITPEQFAKYASGPMRDRVLQSITTATQWLLAACSAVTGSGDSAP